MQGSLDSPPIIIHTSRIMNSIGLIVCGALLGKLITSFATTITSLSFGDYLWLIVLAAGTLYFGFQFIRPAALELSPEGVTWKAPLATKHWTWDSIGNFRVQGVGAIGCDLDAPDSNFRWLRPLNKKMSGNEGALGFGWEGGAEKVVALLTEAKNRWG